MLPTCGSVYDQQGSWDEFVGEMNSAFGLSDAESVLLIVFYLNAKHIIADFFLQNAYQIMNKGRYGHPGGLLHAAIHAVLSAPVLIMLPEAAFAAGVVLLVAEFVVHYHVDWSKELFGYILDIAPNSAAHWRAFGMDQLAHLWTYVAMTWLLVHPAELQSLAAPVLEQVDWLMQQLQS